MQYIPYKNRLRVFWVIEIRRISIGKHFSVIGKVKISELEIG